jgi:hypothetical protein
VRQTATAAPGATATAGAQATGTAIVRATQTSVANATSTASVRQTATAAPGATATARVQATGTAIAGATSTAVANVTSTASVRQTATAAPGATATARVQATGTAIVRATQTSVANATATVVVAQTSTAVVRATSTAGAQATSTAAVRATGTAAVFATATARPAQTATAIVRATGTAAVFATATARAATATAAPTSEVRADLFEYTCRVGTATDSTTGEQCNGFYGTTEEYRNGQWWTTRTYCMTSTECQRNEGIDLDQYDWLPCVFRLNPGGIEVDCSNTNPALQTWNIRAEVYTECPINEVLRAPYPRTLVNLETNFILQPKEYNDENGISTAPQSPANLADFIDADGNPTSEGYDVGVWKNMRLIMRSHRFTGGETWFGDTVPQPRWVFADRAWNAGPFPSQQDGPTAKYQYETSSADLDTRFGRAFDIRNKVPANDFTLPAYPAQLTTYCGHEWMVVADLATKSWKKTGACYATRLYPDGSTYVPPGTDRADCPAGEVAPGEWEYGWSGYQTGRAGPNGRWLWDGINLKDIGRPVSYDQRTRTKAGGVFKDPITKTPRIYWDDPWGLWIPVVEVQSTIRDECVATGACEPISAEPGSLAP